MNLEQIRDLLVLISGENGQQFNYSPEDYCDLLHLAQLKHFKRKLGLPEEYQPGMPAPRQAYEITQKITEDIRHFKVMKGWGVSTPLFLTNGVLSYPVDYFYPSSLSYNYPIGEEFLERNIDILSDKEYADITTSVLKKPDAFFPVCNMQATFIRFAPKLTSGINIAYLRLPIKPFWKVIDNDGFYEYDHSNSVNLEWDDINIIDIIVIMLGDLGIPLNSQNIVQYSQNLKEKGV
jgi:hypothetical protein